MATVKELRHGDKGRWIGSTNKGKKLSRIETHAADDMPDYNPDDHVSLTVPGQSKTIKELMDRYEKGRPSPVD